MALLVGQEGTAGSVGPGDFLRCIRRLRKIRRWEGLRPMDVRVSMICAGTVNQLSGRGMCEAQLSRSEEALSVSFC